MAKKILSDETIYDIFKAKGTFKEIAKKFNVSSSTVYRIKNLEYKKYTEAIKKIEKAKLNEKIDKKLYISSIISALEVFFTPIVVRCVYDNILMDPEFEKTLEKIIKELKKKDEPKLYSETFKIIITNIFSQILKEKYVSILFNRGSTNDK